MVLQKELQGNFIEIVSSSIYYHVKNLEKDFQITQQSHILSTIAFKGKKFKKYLIIAPKEESKEDIHYSDQYHDIN